MNDETTTRKPRPKGPKAKPRVLVPPTSSQDPPGPAPGLEPSRHDSHHTQVPFGEDLFDAIRTASYLNKRANKQLLILRALYREFIPDSPEARALIGDEIDDAVKAGDLKL